MNQLKNILVGIDFSSPSNSALREAARISAWDGARILAVHIVDAEIIRDLKHSIEIDESAVREQGKVRLKKHLNQVLGADHGVGVEVTTGHPFQQFAATADRIDADLIVVGSHGGTDSRSDRVGILAERCIRKSKQNVLLVRGHQSEPFRRIIACVDFSENSRKCAQHAIHIARQDGAELEFLHVRQPVSQMVVHPDFYTGTPPALLPDFDDTLAQQLEGQLGEFVATLIPDGIEIDHKVTVLQEFNHRGALVDHVNEAGVDLVVLGTRGHTTLRTLLMGSTAEKLIHLTRCSALAVKPDGFEYDLS